MSELVDRPCKHCGKIFAPRVKTCPPKYCPTCKPIVHRQNQRKARIKRYWRDKAERDNAKITPTKNNLAVYKITTLQQAPPDQFEIMANEVLVGKAKIAGLWSSSSL